MSPPTCEAANAARPGWDPSDWSVDQAARILLLLAGGGTGDAFTHRLRQLFITADIGETIAFYRGLPLYRGPDGTSPGRAKVEKRHAADVRGGGASEPLPSRDLDEMAWNHMVLKALFIDTSLAPIQGLDRRANAWLMRMLCDYAHERWAAGRPVSPELWRSVGPHADAAALATWSGCWRPAAGGSARRRPLRCELPGRHAAERCCPSARTGGRRRGRTMDWQQLAGG